MVKITFPPKEDWDKKREVVTFLAVVDGKQIICAISKEALGDSFNLSHENPLSVFRKNRHVIEQVAEKLIVAKHYEVNGSILIKNPDLLK